jgi:branched-subunit amino acid transport protein
MKTWLIMIGLGLGTFIIRASFITLFGKWQIPPRLQRALRFIPASILFALVVPQILMRNNAVDLSLSNPRLAAGVAAALVAWRTKNVFITILSGMVVLWLLQALFPFP